MSKKATPIDPWTHPDKGTGILHKVQKKLKYLSKKYPAPDQTTRMKK